MKCKECGYELSDGVKFCPECGKPVVGDYMKRNDRGRDDDDDEGVLGGIGDFLGKIFGG